LSLFQQGLREAGLILLAASLLGFLYTAAFNKGFFGEPKQYSSATASHPSSNLPLIDLSTAQDLFDNGAALFVDARHEFDYNGGHIKGAINIPLKEFDVRKTALAAYPKDKTVVAYCDGAECNSSIELAAKLFAEGFTDVRIFFGGWKEWTAHQLPTESKP
jgi:rhodanese-related sulfurtransferase